MNAPATFAERPLVPHGLLRAMGDATRLVQAATAQALAAPDIGDIELPPAARADPTQIRAIASLYLASTLEMAGLIQAADDLTRLVRTGAVDGDLGDAAQAIEAFWNDRNHRPSETERLSLFGRLFGVPAGPEDVATRNNAEFEELLLNLCDAIMKAADGGNQGRAREAGSRLAESVANAASGMVLELAHEILGSLSQAIAILNNQHVRTLLMARTLWDAVSAIDRKFRRPARPTLTVLRRGRAGMAVLAWLADHVATIETGTQALVQPGDPVINSAVDWVDETLSIVRGQDGSGSDSGAGSRVPAQAPAPLPRDATTWRDLGS
jgi:hypothetical protein